MANLPHQRISLIGYQSSSDEITSAICYDRADLVEFNNLGNLLINSYDTSIKTKKLIKEGLYLSEEFTINTDTNLNDTWIIIGNETPYQSLLNHQQTYSSTENYLAQHNSDFNLLYLFSEADNKWYVSRSDDQGFKPLDEELAKL